MKKLHPDGTFKPWAPYPDEDWEVPGWEPPSTEPNLTCDCGGDQFRVCWWDYPYTGGYLKLVCTSCGESVVPIDDYA